MADGEKQPTEHLPANLETFLSPSAMSNNAMRAVVGAGGAVTVASLIRGTYAEMRGDRKTYLNMLRYRIIALGTTLGFIVSYSGLLPLPRPQQVRDWLQGDAAGAAREQP